MKITDINLGYDGILAKSPGFAESVTILACFLLVYTEPLFFIRLCSCFKIKIARFLCRHIEILWEVLTVSVFNMESCSKQPHEAENISSSDKEDINKKAKKKDVNCKKYVGSFK